MNEETSVTTIRDQVFKESMLDYENGSTLVVNLVPNLLNPLSKFLEHPSNKNI
jgi:hypothetical protein